MMRPASLAVLLIAFGACHFGEDAKQDDLAARDQNGEARPYERRSTDYCARASGVDMVDLSEPVDAAFLKEMVDVGVSTVARYYDHPNEIIEGITLTADELAKIRAFGLATLVVFQHNNNREETFANWQTRGGQDARRALELAEAVSQPSGSAIYFSVDADIVNNLNRTCVRNGDARGNCTSEVIAYFGEVNRILGNTGKFDVGVYGSGQTCRVLRSEGLAKYCWISQSVGFTATTSVLAQGEYDIRQYVEGTCGGRGIDFSVMTADPLDLGAFE